MMPSSAIGAPGHGGLATIAKTADALPRGVVPTAYPTQLGAATALALVVPERLAPVAAGGLRDELSTLKPPPAGKVQEGGDGSPQRHKNLPGGKAASMTGVVVAPLCRNDRRVLQHWVQGQGSGISLEDTPRGGYFLLKDDSLGLSKSNFLQGGGGVPVHTAYEVVPVKGHVHADNYLQLRH